MERSPNFIYWQGGDNTRLAGKMQVHNRLAFDGEGRPMLQIFSTCKNCIRTLPALVYDARRPEDIDTQGEDHIYDMLRYVLMERPIAPPPSVKPPALGDDPLDLGKAKFFQGVIAREGASLQEAPSLALPPEEAAWGRFWGRGRFSERSASPPDPRSRRAAGVWRGALLLAWFRLSVWVLSDRLGCGHGG